MKSFILILSIFTFSFSNKNIEKGKINPHNSANEKNYGLINTGTPESTALTFINSYITDCNKMSESLGYLKFVESSKLTTKEFKKELKKTVAAALKKDPEIGLGFDPILDSQDYPEDGFEFKNFNKKTNLVVVKGKNWPDFELTLKVILVNNKWLIDGCGIINIPKNQRSKR